MAIRKVVVTAWTKCTDITQAELSENYCAQLLVGCSGDLFSSNDIDCGDVWFGGYTDHPGTYWKNNRDWREISCSFTKNLITIEPWTEDDIDTLEIGVHLATWGGIHSTQCHKLKAIVYRDTGSSVYTPKANGNWQSWQDCFRYPLELSNYEILSDELESTLIWSDFYFLNHGRASSVLVERKISTYPSDPIARVSSIHRIYKPGTYRMELGFGDLGFDVDVAEAGVRKVVAEVTPPEAPSTVECRTDADCPSGWRCINGVCVPPAGTTIPLTELAKMAVPAEVLAPQEKPPYVATKTTAPAPTPPGTTESLFSAIINTFKESISTVVNFFKGLF